MEPREIKEAFSFLESKHRSLTPYQTSFLRSLKKYYSWKGNLSQRQVDCLLSLKDYVLATVD
ncbi:MAG TPA: hypothetical protein VK155_09485 [Bacteroidales bacterium]|jgi:hypothetical protein|nr:hypothetical protein [Bacteroidales bacterium]